MSSKASPSELYLGCDISLSGPGFAIIEKRPEGLRLINSMKVKTTSKQSYAQRLSLIEEQLFTFCSPHQPFTLIIREKFASPNPNTSYSVFAAWGAVDRGIWRHRQQVVHEGMAQSLVKKLLTGSGRAEKSDVALRVKEYLNLPADWVFPSNDESDAAAVVIAYLIQEGCIA